MANDKIKYLRVRQPDGTYTQPMPIAVEAENVTFEEEDNTIKTLVTKMDEKAEAAIYTDKGVKLGGEDDIRIGVNSITIGEEAAATGKNSFAIGDEIGLSIESTSQIIVSPSSGTNAYLNIYKL